MPINIGLEAEEFRRRKQMLDEARNRSTADPGTAAAAPPGSTVQTTTFTPSGTMPSLPKLPTLDVPEFDRRKLRAETQIEAGPQVRRLRDVTARALGARFENPNVRRMTVREALQGYGSGLGSILQGARRAAVQQQMPEYQAQVQGAQRTFEANVNSLMSQYQALWNNFLRTGTTTTTTRQIT